MLAQTTTATAVALYARVSTEDQAERQTIQAQLDFLRKYCDLHQIPVAGEYVDDGISGTVPLDRRPEGRRLLDDAEARRFGAVLAYRVDRLGRSLRALLDAHDDLERLGVALRSGTEPIDTSTPIGRFIFQLLGGFAELERNTIQERMTGGRDRIARAGKYTGGPVALGYAVDADGYLRPSERVVEALGVTEADLVRGLFERIAGGSSLVQEAARFQAHGIPAVRRYGTRVVTVGEQWTAGRVWHLLHNPAYKGEAVLKSRNGTVSCPVPALVEPTLWDAAQAQLARNRTLSAKNATRDYLLRGLIRCAHCGRGYAGTAAKKGDRYVRRYRCNTKVMSGRFQAPTCEGMAINAQKIEERIWADIKHWAEQPGDYLAEAQAQLRERLARSVDTEGERRRLLGEIAEKETERERVLTMYRRGRISMDEAERELDAVAAEVATLRGLVESLRAQEALTQAAEAHLTEAAAGLAHLRANIEAVEALPEGPERTAALRQVFDLLVVNVTIRTEGEGRERRATPHVTYAYHAQSAVDSRTGSGSS